MIRRSLFVAAIAVLAACSNCDHPCKEGITFYVTGLAGSLAPGTKEDVQFCFDGKCQTTSVSRDLVGGTVFLPASGVGKSGDHTITVSGPASLSGTYSGPIESFEQKGTGGSCDTCRVGAAKVGADGTLTPGTAVPPSTTAPAPTTTGG
jgi:hypothetical protein